MDPQIISITHQLIPQYFDKISEDLKAAQDQEALKQKLTPIIAFYLDHDFERFLQILYRIDIDENKFKMALQMENIAEEVTELIIKRFIQKAEIRLRYGASTH